MNPEQKLVLQDKIKEQGEVVRKLKAAKASKDKVIWPPWTFLPDGNKHGHGVNISQKQTAALLFIDTNLKQWHFAVIIDI